MLLKTIKINPDLLSLSSGGKSTSSNTKTRKQKPTGISLTQSNNVKKKLIARIKNFQQKEKAPSATITTTETASTNSKPSNSLTESIDFLNNLARDKQEKKREKRLRRKETLKHERTPMDNNISMSIATELPPELSWDAIKPRENEPIVPVKNNAVATTTPTWVSSPEPSYGNLKKGGTKPTYRTWLRNTQKIKPTINVASAIPNINLLDTKPEEKGVTIQTQLPFVAPQTPIVQTPVVQTPIVQTPIVQTPIVQTPIVQTPVELPPPPPYKPNLLPKRKRITRTLKYKLGKHNNGTVSVLIKNSQTRRKIQTEQSLLKQKSILEIKNYLRKNNLLKVGTQAPNDVLRHLYEQSILAGQVENKSKENLIHNYFNDEIK
jgi:hypothetical protein